MSSKVQVVEKYLAALDADNIDGALAFATDDFIYLPEGHVKPAELGLGFSNDGLGRAHFKQLHAKLKESYHGFNTTLDTIKEEGDKVYVTGKTSVNAAVPAHEGKAAHTASAVVPFSAEYTFTGEKISHVKATQHAA
ncbi:hypothetical protein AB1N83_010567 [Pleurotus pulmonarius]|nr:hypothetical protein EYR36_010124 [Pleurotus pulmonarius]